MTTLNNDTITLYDTMTIPAFDASSLSSYTSSHIMSGTAASDTITITGAGSYGSSNTGSNININGTTSSYYVHNGLGANTWSTTDWTTSYGTPFVDRFPEWNEFKKLCNEYPGLEKAYENLKTFYTVCYADSILPKDDE